MLAYIAIFLSTISITLMVIILIKFKKIFTTDKIIEKTKNQMNGLRMKSSEDSMMITKLLAILPNLNQLMITET